MRLLERVLGELTTPRVVRALATSATEKLVRESLKQREVPLSPHFRALAWAEVGVAGFTASYLRRSILRPREKVAIAHAALLNKSIIVSSFGSLEELLRTKEQIGSLSRTKGFLFF